MKRQALIFDLDGTLVDSAPDLRAALNEMLGKFGRRELALDEVRQMIGDGSHALVERALTATGGTDDLVAAHRCFLKAYEAAPTRHSRLYSGVAETLAELRAAGARLAVCTNKPQAATIAVLDGLGIGEYFDVILGGDRVPFRKPDPRHLLAAVEQLNAMPAGAVMIGDNENDFAAARAAGLPVILMRYGYLRVAPETLSPDAWLDDFPAIPRTVAMLPG
jgi:phosphoglycolate phosphatase